MNFFKNAAEHLGAVDRKLIATGILARGEVVKVEPTAYSFGGGGARSDYSGGSTVTRVTVSVIGLPDHAPYQASFLAPIPEDQLGSFQLGGAAVAVRVDPADPQNIALDAQTAAPEASDSAASSAFAGPPPTDAATENGKQIVLDSTDGTQTALTVHAGRVTSAVILDEDSPCTVDVLSLIPIDQKDPKGRPVLGMILNVHRAGKPDVQAEIATYVPPDVAAKIVVGGTVPAKWTPGLDTGDDTVIPDWTALGSSYHASDAPDAK